MRPTTTILALSRAIEARLISRLQKKRKARRIRHITPNSLSKSPCAPEALTTSPCPCRLLWISKGPMRLRRSLRTLKPMLLRVSYPTTYPPSRVGTLKTMCPASTRTNPPSPRPTLCTEKLSFGKISLRIRRCSPTWSPTTLGTPFRPSLKPLTSQ